MLFARKSLSEPGNEEATHLSKHKGGLPMNTTEPSQQAGKAASKGHKTKELERHGSLKEEPTTDIAELAEKAGEQLAKGVARPMNMKELTEEAKSQLTKLTGLKPVGITRAAKDEEGWHIEMDMLEMSRIPPSSDILGEYQTLVDDKGNLLSFERTRTHLRGQTAEKEK